ncbi:hypothetical protein KIW84_041029 [Lathyrus oleraceus]|uniref:Uncharacterized protein n=1 Tax=Pisum sativum TaxID=3888 RepID=A0A9D4X715_PEA|nr:hypothetical protein KIW84_041029 [Pisum sativum]
MLGNSTMINLKEQMQNLPVATQIDKLKARIDMIAAACEGLRLPVDQRHITSSLLMHLADAFTVNEVAQPFPDGSSNNVYMKNTPMSSNNMGGQNSMLQTSGTQLLGRSAASPSAATSATSFDNTTASPIPYANSPRSSTNMMNTPSPQQQTSQLQQQQPTIRSNKSKQNQYTIEPKRP